MLIDKSRAAMGWGRLPENEQDIAIVTWFEILSDSGVPSSQWPSCYRSAQQRENERRREGKEKSIVTPSDLAVEWDKVRKMNHGIDQTRLLPENAASACQRCFGTDKEQMPDGSVKDDCGHLPLSETEIKERAQAKAKSIELMRDAMKKIGTPKPTPAKPEFFNIRMECNSCHRRTDNPMGEAWKDGDTCGVKLIDDSFCKGQLYPYKRIKSPV